MGKNILIINCHWNNRGDEAAIRAMIDELIGAYPDSKIYIQHALSRFGYFPYYRNVTIIPGFPTNKLRYRIQENIALISKGKICINIGARVFFRTLKKADIVIHAPGGPSIGDIYLKQEKQKLKRLLLVKRSGVPYVFYAPSMGPFINKKRNEIRKEILEGAALICLREEQSRRHVKQLVPNVETVVTLDSAFQHPIEDKDYVEEFKRDAELVSFLGDEAKVVGITITDLQWNSLYSGNENIRLIIKKTFSNFINILVKEGYKILFIPQLFGKHSDYSYMKDYAIDNCYILNTDHDCYFQQYIISKLFAVVGMRYHSNIFSAKVGTPFISISYEQKMVGFMEKAKLLDYCINIHDLNIDNLIIYFRKMINTHEKYKKYLLEKNNYFFSESYRTTELVKKVIENNDKIPN